MADDFSASDSIHVDATPREVYDVVSDVTRTGEWSVFTVRCTWIEGADGPRVGARFTGDNVKPDREWQTTSEVTVADPGRAFAWEVNGGLVRWGYELEPDDGGTRLTHTWAFPEPGRAFFRDKFGDDADHEIAVRTEDARRSLPETLAAIRKVVEG